MLVNGIPNISCSSGKSFLKRSFLSLCLDICKDTSDDEYSDANSSHTEGYAVMDVIEYELPDDSESEDDMSSASSGSDVSLDGFLCAIPQLTFPSLKDFLYMAATAAGYEFSALISENQDDEFIFADTEEDSDESKDPNEVKDSELSKADFWQCVKCNNKSNNPLYRFCERCFRVSHVQFLMTNKQKPFGSVNKIPNISKASKHVRTCSLRIHVTSPHSTLILFSFCSAVERVEIMVSELCTNFTNEENV